MYLAAGRWKTITHCPSFTNGLFVAFGIIGDPGPGCLSGRVVHRIVPVGAEVADIFSSVGIHDQNTAVSVAVGDIQAVRCGIHHHVRR